MLSRHARCRWTRQSRPTLRCRSSRRKACSKSVCDLGFNAPGRARRAARGYCGQGAVAMTRIDARRGRRVWCCARHGGRSAAVLVLGVRTLAGMAASSGLPWVTGAVWGGARILRHAAIGGARRARHRPRRPCFLRPVVEYQFTGFIYPAIDQLNHAGRLRNRTQGACLARWRTAPLAAAASGTRAPLREPLQAMFAHIPGIRTVVPTVARAGPTGLLLAAYPRPGHRTVFLELTCLYRASREEVVDDGTALPLDRCFVLRKGRDLTFVTWGAMTCGCPGRGGYPGGGRGSRPRSWTWQRRRRSMRRRSWISLRPTRAAA